MSAKSHLSSYEQKLLKDSQILRELTGDELAVFIKKCTVHKYEAGDEIVCEGDAAPGLFFLLEGEAQVYLPMESEGKTRPSEVKLATFGPGMAFGEYSLLDSKPVSASIRALDRVRVAIMPGKTFRALTEEHDGLGKIVYRNLLLDFVERLRKYDKELDIAFLR